MDFRPREPAQPPAGPVLSAKILIAGGFGAGKTTLNRAISEVPVLATEALMTEAGAAVDARGLVPAKTTATVAMDFGRITLDPALVLYLFSTPGHDRFWLLWDDLARGALGAVVLADTRRLADCFPALDYFDSRGDLPYVVAVNHFHGHQPYDLAAVRDALDLPEDIPLTGLDARDGRAGKQVLSILISHALTTLPDTD